MTHIHITMYAKFHMATPRTMRAWESWRRREKKTARKTLNISSLKSVNTRKNWANAHFGFGFFRFMLFCFLCVCVYDKFCCAQLNDWWWYRFKFFIKSVNVNFPTLFFVLFYFKPFASNTHTSKSHTHFQRIHQMPLRCANFGLRSFFLRAFSILEFIELNLNKNTLKFYTDWQEYILFSLEWGKNQIEFFNALLAQFKLAARTFMKSNRFFWGANMN